MKKLLLLFAAALISLVSFAAPVVIADFSAAGWTASGVNLTTGSTTVGDATWYGRTSAAVASKTVTFSDDVVWNANLKTGGNSTIATGSTLAGVITFTPSAAGTVKVYAVGGGDSSRKLFISQAISSTNRDESHALGSCDGTGKAEGIAVATVEANQLVHVWVNGSMLIYGITFEETPLDDEAPAFTSVTASPASAEVNTNIVLTAAVSGYPTPTFQWYSCDDATKANPVAVTGATAATLTVNKAAAGTYYYYCVATNSEGSATSDAVAAVFTAHVASNACKLLQVVYSNTFDAFITEPKAATEETEAQDGKVKAFYMAGTTEPTISSVVVSEEATYSVADGVVTVTAEDGVTTALYNITVASVEPYAGDSVTFAGTEAWVKNGGGFNAGKGVVISKIDTDWSRESPGKTRAYFFIDECESVTLTNTLIDSKRALKYKVNGGTATEFELGKKSATDGSNSVTIDLSSVSGATMICIESNQTGGDAGFSKIKVVHAAPAVDYYMIGSAELFGTGMKMDANGDDAYRLTLNNVELAGGDYTYNVEARPVVEQSNAPRHIAAAAQAADKSFTLAAGTYSLQFDYNAETGELTSTNLTNGFPTALDNTEAQKVEKSFRNGQVVIIKNGVEYNVLGAKL